MPGVTLGLRRAGRRRDPGDPPRPLHVGDRGDRPGRRRDRSPAASTGSRWRGPEGRSSILMGMATRGRDRAPPPRRRPAAGRAGRGRRVGDHRRPAGRPHHARPSSASVAARVAGGDRRRGRWPALGAGVGRPPAAARADASSSPARRPRPARSSPRARTRRRAGHRAAGDRDRRPPRRRRGAAPRRATRSATTTGRLHLGQRRRPVPRRSIRDLRRLGRAEVAAVGRATAAALGPPGIVADLVPARSDARGRRRRVAGRAGPGGRVLFPRAAGAGRRLCRRADRQGLGGRRRRRVPDGRPGLPAGGGRRLARGADAVTFASPSAVDAYLRLRDTAGRRSAVPRSSPASGRPPAAAARAAGLHVAVEAGQALGRRARRRRCGALGACRGCPALGRRRRLLADGRSPQRRHAPAAPHRRRSGGWSPRPASAVDDLVAPLFVREGIDEPVPIALDAGPVPAHAWPRSSPRPSASPRSACRPSCSSACPPPKDAGRLWRMRPRRHRPGRAARAARGARRRARARSPTSASTSTPTTGTAASLRADGTVDNDATLERYGEIAVAQAEAGADIVAPSGMMDGQVGAIRARARRRRASTRSAILAYAAKYASALYGPFRDAVDVTIAGGGDRAATSRTRPTRARRWPRSRSTSPRAPTW